MTAANQQRKISPAPPSISRPPLLKIYALQCVLVLFASAVALFLNTVDAYSIFIGGVISIVPNAYFARQVFRYAGAIYAQQVARSFYRGETGKFLTTLALFTGTFVLVKPLNVFALFMAYLSIMMLNAFLIAYYGQQRKPPVA